MNVKALIVKTSGEVEVRDLDLQQDMAGLRTLQDAVGGYIEGIVGNGWNGYCNEEGKLLGLPFNRVATALASYAGWTGAGADVLCGDVIFFGNITTTEDEDIHEDVPPGLVALAIEIATATKG